MLKHADRLVVDLAWEHRVAAPRLPVGWLSDDEVAVELQRVQARRAADTAYEAELILQLAQHRPAEQDPSASAPGGRRPGWTVDEAYDGVSEFFTAELSAVLNLGRGTAAYRQARASTWLTKLPATFAALRAGQLDERRATQLAEVLQYTNAEVAGQVEAALLREASELSVARLRARATEELLRLDAAAADERREQAARDADVRVHSSPTDGRSTLAADLPTDEAAECHDLVDQLARMLKADGDDRRIGALRAHVLSTLIRRPADPGLPAVAANVTITADLHALAGVSSTPGEVNGLPITAAHLRDLLVRVGALGLTTPEGGSLTYALTGPDGQLLATTTPAELARLARRGCPHHPNTGKGTRRGDTGSGGTGSDGKDATTGQQCGCAVLGPPPPTDAYTPTDRQRSFLITRDRRCRFPNCGQRVGWTDLDHVTAHACGGATDCTNLCCLCRSHHRLKTFATGWRFRIADDGTLHVTTPSGVTRTTRPPGQRPSTPPPEPEPPPQPDDPPPF
ncbi:HNH endonuclease [Modestobacter caceresii]|uniref:HNH endonuclease n=1 Tax=Modestobacter caceresii TaxID=1522368 RepID=A0A098Y8B8_9ACTN|nr:HNH endonuclease signature motif containing protein [Modestobacter caceresii]KGH45951.1 HNH endonuclease [Modestobacter caceresii]